VTRTPRTSACGGLDRRSVIAGLSSTVATHRAAAQSTPSTVLVAAAADLQDVLPLLGRAFEIETGIAIQPHFDSSQNLAAIIRGDEPFDLVISPDTDLMAVFSKDGLLADSGVVLAEGRLAIAVQTSSPVAAALTLTTFTTALKAGRFRRIAIAHPGEDVFGQRALDVLNQLRLTEFARPKLAYATSVADATQMVISGAADVGILATALLTSEAAKIALRTIEINPSWHRPLSHRMALMPDADEAALKFYAYLQTPVARRTLRQFGYGVAGG
jgi:molybdate transport system substrate-binding protein